MIKSNDRSFYIGASDTSMVVGNWNTKTFDKWYGTKLGIYSQDFTNDAMITGTYYEHKILEALKINGLVMDNQIIIGRLRVNLDGNTDDCIYEVKSHNIDKDFKVSKAYKNQVMVEMFAFGIKKAYIVSYALTDDEDKNFYREIDNGRIKYHEIMYDEDFINNIYVPRLNVLSDCLDRGVWPYMN